MHGILEFHVTIVDAGFQGVLSQHMHGILEFHVTIVDEVLWRFCAKFKSYPP